MPTSLPVRARTKPHLLIVFLVALAAAFITIEFTGPASMDAEATLAASP